MNKAIYPSGIWRPSPNFNQRPAQTEISLVVLHNISLPPNRFGTPFIDDLFMNRLQVEAHPYFKEIAGLEVSAHCLIRREGQVIQYVSFDDRAWHAGESCWQGQTNCNDFSIGIELEGADDIDFDPRQYTSLINLLEYLHKYYPMINSVCGHSDIAPERKTDPGPAFDWQKIKNFIPNGI